MSALGLSLSLFFAIKFSWSTGWRCNDKPRRTPYWVPR